MMGELECPGGLSGAQWPDNGHQTVQQRLGYIIMVRCA